jgi:hypothetical protein
MAAALNTKADLESRGTAIDKLYGAGGVLAVMKAEEGKSLPKAEGDGYMGGDFEGWMLVVRLQDASIACATRLSFTSSETVGGGVRLKYAPKKSVQTQADEDFEKRFEKAAKEAARKIGGEHLRLRLHFYD